jgi:hypothetical protein
VIGTAPAVRRQLPWRRFAILFAEAVVIGVAIFNLRLLLNVHLLSDMNAYWDAAMRLRDGLPLYPSLLDTQAAEVYRYAPWFAFAWVPLTFVPYAVVGAAWMGASLVAGAWILKQVGSLPAAVFLGPLLVQVALIGNVHALLLAGLLWGLDRRSGPAWIAVAASLKGFPIILALAYIGRREWGKLALTLAFTTVLTLPLLAFDLSSYPLSDGGGLAHHYGLPWPLVPAILAVATLVLARGRYGWLAATTTLVFASPGAQPYHLTYPLLGLAGEAEGRSARSSSTPNR